MAIGYMVTPAIGLPGTPVGTKGGLRERVMDAFADLIEANFEWFFFACLLWSLGYVVYSVQRRRARGPVHPPIDWHLARFVERFASGFSRRSWWTRIAGARNALKVVVLDDAILIEPLALWKWVMPVGFNDLEHYIPKPSLVSVEPVSGFGRTAVRLEFVSDDGKGNIVELKLRRWREFLSALGNDHAAPLAGAPGQGPVSAETRDS